MNDRKLLQDYVEHRSQDAFRELVERHLPMVYATARRVVSDRHLAEDVAQAVFTTLARKAVSIPPSRPVGGWLYNTTRHLALNSVRAEQRRREREQTALAMQTLHPEPDTPQISEHLEPAMAELPEDDRDALVLRFFEDRSLREVGTELGVSEDAARMRVNRALEKLRTGFEQREVTVTTVALGAALTASTTAVPPGLAASIATAALAGLSLPASLAVPAGTGLIGVLSQLSRMKFAAGLATTAVVGLATLLTLRAHFATDRSLLANPKQAVPPVATQDQLDLPSANADSQAPAEQTQPDPLSLLQGVARARQRIYSGSMELKLSTERVARGRRDTRLKRFNIVFDGPKLRFESFARSYSYKYSADETEQEEIKKRADSMDNESAVRAGLLKASEAHVVTATDGATLLRYRSNPDSTIVDEPEHGSASSAEHFFDPRFLGLDASLHFGGTIDACLGYPQAKSIQLMGKESVEGLPAWHVQVLSRHDATLDFWIDATHSTRLLKLSTGTDVVLSKYDDVNPRDPIPLEVTTTMSGRDGTSYLSQFTRSNTRWNVSVDPASFTLAGLGMPVGTWVTDVRMQRSIGCWTGSGLTKFLPEKETPKQTPPNLAELLAVLENEPASPEALQAGTWILLNQPDGPEVEKAAEVILREHTRDTNLVYLSKELERMRHRCSKPLLEAFLKDNPSIEVRGAACFALAKILKDEAKYGQNQKATAAAERQFERVIAEFSQVKERGFNLDNLTRPELSELRRLTIGKPAPEIEGEDLNGQAMKLSEYRGQVVVLTFWSRNYIEAPEHRKLVERMAGKPFAFLGVYGDDNPALAKAAIEKYKITWPSFRDLRDGPISSNWNVHSWPSIWVLDQKGVIRHRNLRGSDLANAVNALFQE